MSHVMDLELLKEIPGYKAILKSVIKTQIQLLIEQLCDHTGEESIILTASINDGTLSHLGSNMGKGFFEGRDEIKSQFLGYCLKNHHTLASPQPRTSYQRDQPPDRYQQGPSAPKRQKFHPGPVRSVSQDFEDQDMPGYSVPVVQAIPSPSPNRVKSLPRKSPACPPAKSTTSTISTPTLDSYKPNMALSSDTGIATAAVKVEDTSDSQDSNYTPVKDNVGESLNIPQSVTLPSSVNLSHTQSSDANNGHEMKYINASGTVQSEDYSSIKVEPITEEDLELEITGVEMAGGATGMAGDWGQNVSGEMGYQSTVSDDSLDQSGNQFSTSSGIRDFERKERPLQGDSLLHLSSQNIYFCNLCEKMFPRKNELDRHVKVHTGQKGIICPYCNRAFSRKDNMKIHIWNKHTDKSQFLSKSGT